MFFDSYAEALKLESRNILEMTQPLPVLTAQAIRRKFALGHHATVGVIPRATVIPGEQSKACRSVR